MESFGGAGAASGGGAASAEGVVAVELGGVVVVGAGFAVEESVAEGVGTGSNGEVMTSAEQATAVGTRNVQRIIAKNIERERFTMGKHLE